MEINENAGSSIDFERLREVSNDDAEMMEMLTDLYFSQTEEQLSILEKAVFAKDFDAIYKTAHKIAGGSMTCGMNAIVAPIRELESLGKSHNSENTENLLAQSMQAFEEMKEYMEASKALLIA